MLKIIFIFIFCFLPFYPALALDGPDISYRKMIFNYGLSIVIILFFVVGSFVLSRKLRPKRKNKKEITLDELKKDKTKSLEEAYRQYIENKQEKDNN